jgi:murein hydrolase activator
VPWPSRSVLGLALAGALLAGELRAEPGAPPDERSPHPLRATVVAALEAQRAAAERALATVEAQRSARAAARARRARAAYKALRSGGGEPLPVARRRAAARWLLARDRHEEQLLADEVATLAAATARLAADRAAAAVAPLPPAGLDRPARGALVRRFGPYRHDGSGATLTRRGVDLEVADRTEVRTVAAGVVRYAGPIRGLDHGVVVDHGGWLSVIGKLAPPAVAAGDVVARSEVIGQAARRRVYLEVRVAVGAGGLPIDPEPLLAR